jgi:hypothetical protein
MTQPPDTIPSLMDEISGRLGLLESKLPKRVDAMAVSPISKLPWKALVHREALAWRMAELARAAFQNFERDTLVAAIVVTRAAVETSAALWYLYSKVDDAAESNAIGDIDDYLMKLLSGMATTAPKSDLSDPEFPRPVKISAFLNQVEKDIEGYSHQYGILSEYAHPNGATNVILYAKHDQENRLTDFGKNMRHANNAKLIGVVNLSVALRMFETSYNRIGELIPAFTKLCESGLDGLDPARSVPALP